MSILEIQGLKIIFPGRKSTFTAAKDISLTLEAGKILGVVGESGAGKSTIGNAIIGLLPEPGKISEGEIHLQGQRIDQLPEKNLQKLRGKRIGMIFQDPLTCLNPLQTIESQLVETIRTHLDINSKTARARAVSLLEDVGIQDAESRIRQYPHQFSGGMRQRVVIALALCAEPELVIADEPTTALDVSIQAQVLKLMRDLCTQRNVAMMVITHDMGVIAEITDHVAVMYQGMLVEYGATAEVLGAPSHAYTKSLIASVPRTDACISRFPSLGMIEKNVKPAQSIDITTHWLGQKSSSTPYQGPLLSITGLCKRFETRHSLFASKRRYFDAVKSVSFDIHQGDTFGLVGESGSGKSTLARLITGLEHPTAGKIHFAGQELTGPCSKADISNIRRQMQMIFQDPFSSLNPRMRVRSIIAEPIHFHRLANDRREIHHIVDDLLDHVGLGARAGERFPHEFSGGQRQRISIARALASRPDFLICDEPTSALDVSIQAQILNLLKDLQEELGLTMLFISHDLAVIRHMCDRVGVMQHGELCEIADCKTLFESPQHPYTQKLLKQTPSLDLLYMGPLT